MKKINSLMQTIKKKILSTVISYIGFKDLEFLLTILHRGHINFKSISKTPNPLVNKLQNKYDAIKRNY
tara:strand:+ start:253 stop:456 length:204 start_codon:yes stop_codon:yes gene_type:complete